uniref:Uncharacterized protein n=1 Tax=Lactuca sativa TaxID=4236 RepID=A0A9R1XVG0_LACSA|nr:hypothetical protein LSAT_V11C200075580 [Lactuca sativa]
MVESRRVVEENKNFKTMNSKPIRSSIHPIEAKADQYLKRKEWIEATQNFTHETLKKYIEEFKYRRIGDLLAIVSRIKWMSDVRVLNLKHMAYYANIFRVSARCIGMDEINIENEVSALYLWYVCANCTKAIELAKDSPSKIKKFKILVVKFLEDEIIQKKPNGPENASQDSCTGISQVTWCVINLFGIMLFLLIRKSILKMQTRLSFLWRWQRKRELVLTPREWVSHYVTMSLVLQEKGRGDFTRQTMKLFFEGWKRIKELAA